MVFEVIFIIELLFLFFTSKIVHASIFRTAYRFTNSKGISITILSLIFFPGVLIHELSHLLMAGILFVPVGDMELVPKVEGESVTMGSVRVAQTDFIRRFFIGIAPLLMGGSLLLITIFYFAKDFSFEKIFVPFNIGVYILFLYVIFVVVNTMFSSKKDMEGTVELLVVLLIISVGAFFAAGAFLSQVLSQFLLSPRVVSIAYTADLLLLLPVGINLVFLLVSLLKRR